MKKPFPVELPAGDRVAPACPHFGPCGGCSLQDIDYPAQVRWKQQVLERILGEAALGELPPVAVTPMDRPWEYRSKMEFSFGQEGARVTAGLHQRESFQRIVDIDACGIAAPAVSGLLRAVKEVANRFPLAAYHPRTHQGFWRHAVIRRSRSTGALMLLLMTNEGPQQPVDALKAELPARFPELRSFYWGISTKVSDVAQPERLQLVHGAETIEDLVGDVRFEIRPGNFVQPNLLLAERIYRAISEAARLSGRENVYDLYCGMGLIGLSLARDARSVTGVESEPDNVALAERNARLNGITNASFLRGKVEDLVRGRALFKAGPPADVLVIDPPRAGLHKDAYGPLLEAAAPALIYLSCNPASLARDLKALLEREPRYKVDALRLFDFFPHTPHMEVLAALRLS